MSGPISFSSHRVEVLYTYFKAMLFNEYTDAFTKRIVIVPSPLVRSWLEIQMANDPDLSVSMGVQWSLLTSFVDQLPSFMGNPLKIRKPYFFELSLRIEDVLKNLHKEVPKELRLYIHEGRNEKITELADYLARLFILYGQYPQGVLPLKGWQELIWSKVYSENRVWDGLYIENILKNSFQVNNLFIHVFPVSYLSRIQHQVLSHFSQFAPVYYYHLNPSQYFWGDIRSSKEKARNERRGIKNVEFEGEQQVNSLLASWGRLGRHFLNEIVENVTNVADDYTSYSSKDTLLHYIQEGISGIDKEGIKEVSDLNSIQFHCVSQTRREVEVALDLVKDLLGSKGYQPNEILILSPNIHDYLVHIECVFGTDESKIPYQVLDLGREKNNLYAKALLTLLDLARSRWSTASILRLLDTKVFQQQFFHSLEDVDCIREWILNLGIQWGMDPLHRDQRFLENYKVSIESKEKQHSWEFAFERLLQGLFIIHKNDMLSSKDLHSYEQIEGRQASLLARWVALFRELFHDLSSLRKNEDKTVGDWIQTLLYLLHTYFDKSVKISDFEELEKIILTLTTSTEGILDYTIPFSTIEYHLKNILSKELTNTSSYYPSALHFCSLFPMRSIPSKAIIIMGMCEEDFPRRESYFALNQLKESKEKEYCPTQQEYDRYLFLETILSAREYIYFTYARAFKGGKTYETPSLVLQELLHFLDDNFLIHKKKPSEVLITRHPSEGFDSRYYEKNSLFKTYSKRYYELAKRLNNQCFEEIPNWEGAFTIQETSVRKVDSLTLSQLIYNLKSPLKAYCNHTLGIWCEKLTRTHEGKETLFSFSHLDNWRFRQELLTKDPQVIIKEWRGRGYWPLGSLGEMAEELVFFHKEELDSQFESLGIIKDGLKQIILSEKYHKQTEEEGIIGAPPIHINGIRLSGFLGWVSSRGLILDKKSEQNTHLVAWPLALVLEYLNLPQIEKNILFLKSQKSKEFSISDPQKELNELLTYHQACYDQASLLFPSWMKSIYSADEVSLSAQFKKEEYYPDTYFQWAFSKQIFPEAKKVIDLWQPRCVALMETFVKTWHPEWVK